MSPRSSARPSRWARGAATVLHPGTWRSRVTGGSPLFPLVVLFGLNAVDELDRTAFGILLPDIQDSFGLDLQGVLALVAVVLAGALALQVPIAHFADRHNRVAITIGGAIAWGVFSVLTGLATTVVMLAVVRAGSGIGKAVVDPTHNSLLADYYPVEVRPRVYSVHRAANVVGQVLGPLLAGLLAYAFGWRTPFFVFAIPTFVFVVLAFRLREPVRGAQERRAMGATDEAVATEELPPSFAESWRMVWRIEALRRIWYALPFLAASLIGFVSLASLLYADVFDLDERARGVVAAGVEPLQFAGLIVGARVGTRLIARDPGLVLRFVSVIALVTSGLALAFALAPNLAVAVVANALIAAALAIIGPGILAALSLAIPPRARSLGFSVASLWVLPGLLVLPVIGWVGDTYGIRLGMAVMTPVFLVGGVMIATAGGVIGRDIEQVWTTAAARSEALWERRHGNSKILLVRKLNVSYGSVQVLFDVDLDVEEGSVIALLGTNGAGKSTLLKAVAGLVPADRGAVIFDGRETTFAPADEVAGHGVVLMPGGAGVFPTLTVAENLEVATWLDRRGGGDRRAGIAGVLERFPVLAGRLDEPAANLSGGQQQMLALGMALLSRPRLVMIDELTLGLAPVVVAELVPVVGELRDAGTTVILVEQSVNLALTLAETAYFMEKGEIRFHGPTAELLERPDVLRSVFLEGAAGRGEDEGGDRPAGRVGTGAAAPSGSGHEPATAALAAVDLGVSFGGIRAVDGVSLAVAPGEVVGLIGPNGAGKTTLFDLVGGYTRAGSGQVLLGGRDVTGAGPDARARLGLGRSFQDGRLFPSLTVEETIAVSLERWVEARDPLSAALRLPHAYDSERAVRRRVDEIIGLLGLGGYRDTPTRELSTGTRRIVDLAALVAHRPTVVLLDEPSSGIAQREAEALGPLLARVRDEMGASLVVIEHDIALVRSIADRLVALDQGRVVASGPPDEVLHHPDVVESYLGTHEAALARSDVPTVR
ncbi:MAG: MFS transporter [Acidimicrobiales bacterium]|nr:MFS transporter [Acidimicrobiales bacterium]MCB9372845.1 MFS transporter [Microthrixaceae bacterium]